MTWAQIWTTAVDAWLYGLFGTLAGALVTWVLARPLWRSLARKMDAHTAALQAHTAAVDRQTLALTATLARKQAA